MPIGRIGRALAALAASRPLLRRAPLDRFRPVATLPKILDQHEIRAFSSGGANSIVCRSGEMARPMPDHMSAPPTVITRPVANSRNATVKVANFACGGSVGMK